MMISSQFVAKHGFSSILILTVMHACLSACSSATPPTPQESARPMGQSSVLARADRQIVSDESLLESRTVIRSADVTIKADSSELIHEEVNQIVKTFGGYIVKSERDKTIFRILAKHFEIAIDSIEALGEVLDKQVYGHDVTDQYRDLEVRLDNALKTRDRYLALLESAKTVNEMLMIEKELERLNGKIESLKGEIQELSHLSEFATITVRTKLQFRRGILGEVGYQVYRGVSWLFVRH